ncbi:hypothetical protein E4T56_gene15290 [Termitomyces sp. T112]|nr:hypothetical protein E4T56_gene15290 [Termitomyces sp. T112]
MPKEVLKYSPSKTAQPPQPPSTPPESSLTFHPRSSIGPSPTFLPSKTPDRPSHLLQSQLSPAFILSITRTAKRTLFPTGYPAPTLIDPTPEEQAEFRARLVAWRPRGALATCLLPLLLGPDPSQTLDAALDPLSSTPCNVHLVLFLLDLVVLELFPELALSVGNGNSDGDSGC